MICNRVLIACRYQRCNLWEEVFLKALSTDWNIKHAIFNWLDTHLRDFYGFWLQGLLSQCHGIPGFNRSSYPKEKFEMLSRGIARGHLGVLYPPPPTHPFCKLFWSKQPIQQVVKTTWGNLVLVPSLSHSVTPLLKTLATPLFSKETVRCFQTGQWTSLISSGLSWDTREGYHVLLGQCSRAVL